MSYHLGGPLAHEHNNRLNTQLPTQFKDVSAEAAQAASACVPLLDSQSKLASSSSIRKKIVYDEAPADGEHALDTIPKALQDLLKELIENNVLLKGAKLVRLQVNCKAHFHFVHVDPRACGGQRNYDLRASSGS